MPTIGYRGRVAPDIFPLTIEMTPRAIRTGAEEDPDGEYTGRVRNGLVEIDVKIDEYKDELINAHYFPALSFARSMIHVPSFLSGIPYIVFLETAITPSGEEMPMVLADRSLGDSTTIRGTDRFQQIVELALTDLGVSELLSDAAMMLTTPNYAPIAGGRIADSIAHLISGGRSHSDWEKMRNTLNVTRDYVQFLSDNSTGPRHGDRVYISGSEVHAIAEHAWALINRYLEYRLGGQKLSKETFPVLTRNLNIG